MASLILLAAYHQRSADRGGSAGRDSSNHRHAALRRYDQKTKSDVVADSDCYGSTVNFVGPGRRRI